MFGSTPPVVKNLLIINALMLLLTNIMAMGGMDISNLLALHHWSSDLFNPFQLVTYLFMHGGFMHLLLNMFALWMFGRILEQVWGSKRFLIYYFFTGIGAGIIQLIVISFSLNAVENEVATFQNNPDVNGFRKIAQENFKYLSDVQTNLKLEIDQFYQQLPAEGELPASALARSIEYTDAMLNSFRNLGTVGASGSVFGILLAFGMLFPNTELLLLFPPIPIKAKYLVIGYGLIELGMGIANNPKDNVAHFAHLGGMLFGFILIRYWKKNSNHFI